MMKIFFLSLLVSIQAHMTWAQNQNVSLNFRYGISTNNLKTIKLGPYSSYQYLRMRSLNDLGLQLEYSRSICKKYGISLLGGIDLSKSTHYQQLIESKSKRHLSNIIVKKPRLDFEIGFSKRIILKKNFAFLDISLSAVYRQFFREKKNYSQGFMPSNQDWIHFSYGLETYHGKWYKNSLPNSYTGRFGRKLGVFLKFRLSNSAFLNFGMSYITRNTFFYDYRFSVHYFQNGSTTPTSKIMNLGFIDGTKNGVNDNYLYLNIGYTYKFKSKKGL